MRPEGTPQNIGALTTQLITDCPEANCAISLVTKHHAMPFGYNEKATIVYRVVEGQGLHLRYEGRKLRTQPLLPGDLVIVPPRTAYANNPVAGHDLVLLALSTPPFDRAEYVEDTTPRVKENA